MNIDEFVRKTENIYEVEYGDFRRKISQYLQRMEESLGKNRQNPEVRKIIGEIRRHVVYQPQPDIESARLFVVDRAKKLKGFVS